MADSNIGALPQVEGLYDDSMLVVEQQGQAMKVSGEQFKEFGRQAVIEQVQGYVDQAQAAANQAVDAVSAVTDMTVEAHPSDTASVAKTTKNGKVNLNFGLPKGEQGPVGPEGPPGARGLRGETGKGLTILGYYDSQTALEAAVTAPDDGDAYGVGTAAPYDIYIFDGVSETWKNNGPLSGGGGGIIPENVVTCDGGASMEISDSLGDAPHVITFTDEEEPPLTAEDIVYEDGSVQDALDDLKSSVSSGKAIVASAITDKGVETAQDATFAQMAENIEQISSGDDTSDATATSFDILAPKTAYTANGKVTGSIPTLGAQTITPGTADKTIANGQYLGGTQTIKGDPNLVSNNIRKDVSLFGVVGAMEVNFLATLTVTADVGAVVTATHSGGTSVSALSTTGTVTLELPIEGTWTVTAQRGVAQYNTVTINVTSTYSAALTAEVHIVRYGYATTLNDVKYDLAATSVGGYALFAGGQGYNGNGTYNTVESYDEQLTHKNESNLSEKKHYISAASVGNYALFAGGCNYTDSIAYSTVDTYGQELVKTTAEPLSSGRYNCGSATIGNFAIFAGGADKNQNYAIVEAYNENLVKSNPDPLQTVATPKGASNDNYALFCKNDATAYNESLTRMTATSPSISIYAAAKAGNYIVFCGEYSCQAYDLFLTRVTAEQLGAARTYTTGTTVNNFAIFFGGYDDSISFNYGSKAVDVYDAYLVRTSPSELLYGRYYGAATTVNNFALFAGGRRYNVSGVVYVDVYKYV